MGLLDEALRIADNAGDQSPDRLDHRHRGDLAAVEHVVAQAHLEHARAGRGVIGDARACGLMSGAQAEAVPGGQCGRLLAMADPSAFINLMLRYPGNRNFARGVLKYLLEDDSWGRRAGTLRI